MQISDNELILKLKHFVRVERKMLLEVLRHLLEVERRELYLARGYSSLFVFCQEELGYSGAEAQVRIQAMRLMNTVAGVEVKLENGELSLTVAAMVQGCAKREKLGIAAKTTLINAVAGISSRAAERKIATFFPHAINKEVEKPISAELTRIEFNVSNVLLEKLHRLKDLFAHKNFAGRYDLLFEEIADIALAKFNAPVLRAPAVTERQSRYIPKSLQKNVRDRAQNRCQYIDPLTKRRCDSTHALQIDHIKEFSRGGTRSTENLQILCGAHNRWKSRRLKIQPTI